MRLRLLLLALVALLIPVVAAGCGGDGEDAPPPVGEEEVATEDQAEADEDVSGDLQIMAVWTGPEQASFEAVLEGFSERYPNVNVSYNSAGDQLPTQLATAVEGGNPPDIAVLPQPGLMADFAEEGALQPIDFAEGTMSENFSEDVLDIGRVDGTLYGLLFKAANKSTVWYNVQAFEDAGVEPPETWDELTEAAGTLQASGVPAYSIAGADGWTLTDWFENVYIRTAGPDLYDQLSNHEIPWTHESVRDALETLADVFGDEQNIAGGTSGALQTDFPTSVTQVFADPPEAAIVYEGDFVAGVITDSTDAQPEEGFNVFDFPSIDDSPPSVVGGGDLVTMFRDSPAAQALVEYLATPEAAQIWAERGGFSSLNQNVDPNVYPDPITQATASSLAEAEVFRFDLSDLQPAEFGGTVGQGLFALFQDYLRNPDNIDQVTQQMENQAQQAHGGG